ncbi:MAG: GNAT family N-acetyltransferase [Acidobacteriota bacterium]
MTVRFDRIQACFRESARRQYEAVPLPPFTLFFHPTDALVYMNYAIPDVPDPENVAPMIPELRRIFARRGRVARFELVEEHSPRLGGELAACGFRLEPRGCLMVAAASEVCEPPRVPGLSISCLRAGARDEDVAASVSVFREAFGMEPVDAIGPAEIASQRHFVENGTTIFVGAIDGQAVGLSCLQPAYRRVAEIAGVGTRVAFRRRGIGAALTYAAAAHALEGGVDTLVLGAGTLEAGRVYGSCGFRAVGSTVGWIDSGAGDPE